MSWLSENLGNVAGGLTGLGFGSGLGAYIGGKYGNDAAGMNRNAQGGSPQGLSLSPQAQ